MGDPHLGDQWRHISRITRGERDVTTAIEEAIAAQLEHGQVALDASGMNADVLDSRSPAVRAALNDTVGPAIEKVFTDAFTATGAGNLIDPGPYATRHLESVHNRLVGISDTTFDTMRTELEAGRQLGESIPQLSKRIDSLIGDDQRWKNRAATIARTEVLGANNSGSYQSAAATATYLGHQPSDVVKEWLATGDARTRPTHADVSGTQVQGIDTDFSVGDSQLSYACDPSGSADEVVNCRCTVLYLYPGDPGYPDGSTATATTDDLAGPAPEKTPADPAATAGTAPSYPTPASPIPVTQAGLVPERDFVDKIHGELKAGKVSPDQLRNIATNLSDLGKTNVNAALGRYEADLAELAAQQPRTFKTVGEAKTWAAETWPGTEGYTEAQVNVIRDYTGSGYGPMNNTLRSSNRINEKIRTMDSAIDAAPRVPENVQVVRNTSLRQLGINTTTGDPSGLIGSEFVDKGYLSTSINPRFSGIKGDIKLNITVPAGSKGIYVSGNGGSAREILSSFGGGESELILARGTRLKVTGVRKVGGKWVVDVLAIQG